MTHAIGRWLGVLFLLAFLAPTPAQAQHWLHDDGSKTNRSIFRLMDEWPTPNGYRTGAGSPGPDYWQQKVDYVIETSLDTATHVVTGSERITYHNNSPEELTFLWVQLDQNVRSIQHSRSYQQQGALPEEISPGFRRFVGLTQFDGGHNIVCSIQHVSDCQILTAQILTHHKRQLHFNARIGKPSSINVSPIVEQHVT